MINQAEIVKKNWADVSGEIQKNWSKLTHDDIEKTKGSVSAISTLVQQKPTKPFSSCKEMELKEFLLSTRVEN